MIFGGFARGASSFTLFIGKEALSMMFCVALERSFSAFSKLPALIDVSRVLGIMFVQVLCQSRQAYYRVSA